MPESSPDPFEPRELVIADERVWEVLTDYLGALGLTVVQGPDRDNDQLPWYFLGLPTHPPKEHP